jgi:hypothetical protein
MKSPATKRKVAAVLRGIDNAARELDDDGDLFEDHNNAGVLSKRSTWSNSTNPELVCHKKKTTCHKQLADELTPDPPWKCRQIAPLHTVRLTRPLLKMSSMSSNNPLETSLKLDSHADMTVLGAGALIIQSYD